MRSCLFCGNPKTSREHVISHAVWERLQGGDSELEIGVWDGERERDFRPGHRQDSFVTRSACVACNTGWMSRLEVDFLSVVGPLIEPTWPILSDDFIRQAVIGGEVIAQWSVKTAVTSNLSGVVKRPIHTAIPRNLAAGILPPYSAVLLGFVEERAFALKMNRGFWFKAEDGTLRWQGPAHNTAFDFILHLNHLAIRVFCGPHLNIRFHTECRGIPVRCYPFGTIESGANYSFPTLNAFEGKLVGTLVVPPVLPTPEIPIISGR